LAESQSCTKESIYSYALAIVYALWLRARNGILSGDGRLMNFEHNSRVRRVMREHRPIVFIYRSVYESVQNSRNDVSSPFLTLMRTSGHKTLRLPHRTVAAKPFEKWIG